VGRGTRLLECGGCFHREDSGAECFLRPGDVIEKSCGMVVDHARCRLDDAGKPIEAIQAVPALVDDMLLGSFQAVWSVLSVATVPDLPNAALRQGPSLVRRRLGLRRWRGSQPAICERRQKCLYRRGLCRCPVLPSVRSRWLERVRLVGAVS
jgi:hypothetical protein